MCKRKVIWMFSMLFAVMIGLSSCTKKSDEVYDKDDERIESEKVPVNENDFIETDKDLLEVDYKKFYEELSPHGEWIKVGADELGIDLKGENAGESGSILNDLIGVKNAYADDFGFGMFFVWRPSPNLAVSVVAGEPPVYVPYVNGRWINSDYGWYFMAPTPYEEITVHYGRWVWHPYMGWVWIPGRVWAPAWVEWRVTPSYIAWAPLPPSVYIVNHVISPVVIYEDRFIVVERRYFCEPEIYRHSFFFKDHKHKLSFHDLSRPDGIMVVNNKVINRGPDVISIEKSSGKRIERVKINKIHDMKDVKYSGNEYSVYSHKFERIKTSDNRKEPVSKPDKFVSLDGKKNQRDEKLQQDNDKMNSENNDKSSGSKKAGRDFIQKDKNSKKLGDDRGMKNSERLDKYNKDENYKQKSDYKQRNENRQKGDYKQKKESRKRDNYKQRNESKQKDNYKQRNENKQKDNYRQKQNDRGSQKNYDRDKGNKKPISNDNYIKRNNERKSEKVYKQERNNKPVKEKQSNQSRNDKKSYREKGSEKTNDNYEKQRSNNNRNSKKRR